MFLNFVGVVVIYYNGHALSLVHQWSSVRLSPW